ncbi:MAG: replicative DNA helicase [Firmicutes bacterium]|nr:replicative DNA helicase [Bacillota bacterium]
MLFDKEAILAAHEVLSAEHFHRADYKAVFQAMVDMFGDSFPVDAVTLKNYLEKKGIYDRVGGSELLAEMAANISSTANIHHYAKILHDRALLRVLLSASTEIQTKSIEGLGEADHVLEYAERLIFNISKSRDSSDFTHIKDALADSIKKVEEVQLHGSKITGIPSGFTDFDMKTAGLQPSNLILIAARPSMGKSMLAINIAAHVAIRHKVTTAFFSLEMSKMELTNRIICSEGMIPAQNYRTGEMVVGSKSYWENVADVIGSISTAPLYLDDTAGITIPELRAKCRRLKLEKNLGLIIVDYLQLMSGSRRAESRQQEISEISRSLKAIAREMECPVIALAQLSRACEQRADRRPILSDLRESGAIEQDADIVSFIYRDEYYNPHSEKHGIAEWIISKQRNGPTGTVELAFLSEYVRFANMQR